MAAKTDGTPRPATEARGDVYPLLFTLHEVVVGNGFLAAVSAFGQGLMVREGAGDWWLYGVQPGSVAACGASPQEAYLKFCVDFKAVLFDIATECADFDEYDQAVQRFFREIDNADAARWQLAADDIRSGRLIPVEPFSTLEKKQKESEPTVTVQRLDQARLSLLTPEHNVLNSFATAA